MYRLPYVSDDATYWQELYKQPLAFWQHAIQTIVEAHDLPDEEWSRAAMGRNVVFLAPSLVIKLGPPCWPGEMAREAAALQFVAGRLPVTTPELVASGRLDGWEYLVQRRLPGHDARELWPQLDAPAKARLACQHGEIMAALHHLPSSEVPPLLAFDWDEMLEGQRGLCVESMQKSGVAQALVEQIEPYLAATPWQSDQDEEVLLHGDLASVNLMVAEVDGAWTITGVIDWGDAKIGPPSHEFISPGVYMYQGDPALQAWYQGYQLAERLPDDGQAAAYQHLVMARSMLYYSDDFGKRIQHFAGAAECTGWQAIAALFWRMSPDLC